MEIKGIIPALVTPYDSNNSVDYGALKDLIERLIGQGVGGFYACGSTAECFLLSDEERRKVAETVVKASDGRVPVVVHVGNVSTQVAMDLAKHAEDCGATAVSAVPPFYYNFSQNEIAGYYHDISSATHLPMIIYSIPAFSGVAITANNLSTIMDNCNVKGLKYTSYDLFELDRISRRFPELNLYGGHDEVFCNALPIGLAGAIGSTFNVLTPQFISLQKKFLKGDVNGAAQDQKEINKIIDVLIKCGVIHSVKYLLGKKGIPCADSRKPFGKLKEEEMKLLDNIVGQLV